MAHLPPTDPDALELRYRSALDDLAPGTTARTRELTAAIEAAGDSRQHRALLGRALLLLARRLGEDGDDEAALAATKRAEELFDKLGEPAWRAHAVRGRAGALLRLRRIDEALALVEPLFDVSHTGLKVEGMYRVSTASDPIAALLANAARVVLTATRDAPEWVRALGEIAEHLCNASAALRYKSAQDRLAERRAEEEREHCRNEIDIWDREDRIV